MTRECDPPLSTGPVKGAGVSLFSSAAGATVLSAQAWALHDTWITPEELLQAPRLH